LTLNSWPKGFAEHDGGLAVDGMAVYHEYEAARWIDGNGDTEHFYDD
jgi:hypothetical protein